MAAPAQDPPLDVFQAAEIHLDGGNAVLIFAVALRVVLSKASTEVPSSL